MLVSYSGKWTPFPTIQENAWLGALDQADVDPRVAGPELYTGGEKGNLYQIRTYPNAATDHRLIATFPGREIHTIVAADVDPRTGSAEILVFTNPGALYRVTPTGEHGAFESVELEVFPGRIRDALVLPAADGKRPRIATVSRTGELALLHFGDSGHHWTVIHRSPVGKGRVCAAETRADEPLVLYTTQDDGVVLRHVEMDGVWSTKAIHYGHEGPRGITAGRFDAEADSEQLAIFGYSGNVELLTRRKNGWDVETIFEDRDRGHWLSSIEIDGRNATRELVACGYGGRIILLARPPGYGHDGSAAVTGGESSEGR
jgi:hypothetical protein